LTVEYLLMCCFDEKKWDAIPQQEREGIMRRYGDWVDGLVKSGHYRTGGKLRPSSTATTLRAPKGRPAVMDGPFAETKEQLGGYHVIRCGDLDEAMAIANRIPTLPAGGAVEVRPLEATLGR
jgi:hypothetical protein